MPDWLICLRGSDMDDMEIFFNDPTILEADGDRIQIDQLMHEDGVPLKEWMLESFVALSDGLNESSGLIQLWSNGEAILKEFNSGFYDEPVPVDAICLREYLIEKGWDFLPSEELVEGDKEFWDRFFAVVDEDDVEYDENEYDEQFDYRDEENFLEYADHMKEYRKPTANKYNMLSLDEFKDHEYDLKKRAEKEEQNQF